MKIKSIVASLMAILMLTACEELFEDKNLPDGTKPDVQIASPTTNRVFTKNQGLPIKATFVDSDLVKDITFKINGAQGDENVLTLEKHPNVKIFEIDTVVVQDAIAAGNYTLEITAVDKRSNITQKSISFSIKN